MSLEHRHSELDSALATAGRIHGDSLVLLCSFQKESSILVDAVVRNAPETRIVTIDTGVLFEETRATWRAFSAHFQITIESVSAAGDWTGPDHCCSARKVAALERALRGASAWITGIRREQGPTRAQTQPIELDRARQIVKYCPLAAWTERDVWSTIEMRALPYNALHDAGYDSIGCAPCTRPGSGREGRWAGTGKTECGLHAAPGPATAAPFRHPRTAVSTPVALKL